MREIADRLDKAVHALEAIESAILNLSTNLQIDVAHLAQARASAETLESGALSSAAVLRMARAMVRAEECEESVDGFAQALRNGRRLAGMWISLLAPGRHDAVALARANTLSTLTLAEDFIDKFSRIIVVAEEACARCQMSADALRDAANGDQQ